MLNWIVWNRAVLTFNCVWIKTILILNWIVLIRTVWLNWIAWNRNVWQLNCILVLNWIVWNRTDYLVQKWIWHLITYEGWYAIKANQYHPRCSYLLNSKI